jgi:hypothetical protein
LRIRLHLVFVVVLLSCMFFDTAYGQERGDSGGTTIEIFSSGFSTEKGSLAENIRYLEDYERVEPRHINKSVNITLSANGSRGSYVFDNASKIIINIPPTNNIPSTSKTQENVESQK